MWAQPGIGAGKGWQGHHGKAVQIWNDQCPCQHHQSRMDHGQESSIAPKEGKNPYSSRLDLPNKDLILAVSGTHQCHPAMSTQAQHRPGTALGTKSRMERDPGAWHGLVSAPPPRGWVGSCWTAGCTRRARSCWSLCQRRSEGCPCSCRALSRAWQHLCTS